MISQVQAARLMAAAKRWAKAIENTDNSPKGRHRQIAAEAERSAERAFAELVAQLTDSEGL